jgi:hypothetical protein
MVDLAIEVDLRRDHIVGETLGLIGGKNKELLALGTVEVVGVVKTGVDLGVGSVAVSFKQVEPFITEGARVRTHYGVLHAIGQIHLDTVNDTIAFSQTVTIIACLAFQM